MKKNDFRTVFDPPKRVGFHFNKPSVTCQSFSFETDINNIVKGCISSLPSSNVPPRFGEHFSADTYQQALNIIADSKSQFDALPSHIRKKFDNDPKKLLAFVSNKDNLNEAISLGLVEKPISSSIVNQEGSITEPQPASGATSEASAQ